MGKKHQKNLQEKNVPKTTQGTPSSTPVEASKGAENRKDVRVPVQLLVDYQQEGHYLFDFSKDIGTGGVFIQTDKPLPVGSKLKLTFTIPDSKETLTTEGTVLWNQTPMTISDRTQTPGMGIQFHDFDVSSRKTLESFVERYHPDRSTHTKPA